MNVDVLGIEKFENPQVSGTIDHGRDQADQGGRHVVERDIFNQRQDNH